MKLSIIVPVYNVEKYIVKCISSLLNQDSDNYEIIIVNDGTKDNSMELIRQNFDDSKLHIINQVNKGLSCARNTGLKYASGEYIWFFDSDDWVSENVLSGIIDHLHGCDILYFIASYEESENGLTKVLSNRQTSRMGRELSLSSYLHGVPFYIYKHEFLDKNKLLFEEKIFHEDTLFTPCTLYMAGPIIPYENPVYHRLLHNGSITHSINPKRCLDLCLVISKLVNFADNNISLQDRYLWGNCIADATNGLLSLSFNCNDKQVKEKVRKFVNNRSIVRYLLHARKRNTRILGYISYIYCSRLYEIYNFLFWMCSVFK